MFLNTAIWVIQNAVSGYYFKYVVEAESLLTVFFQWMLPANIIGVVLTPVLTAKFGKKNIFILGFLLFLSITVTVIGTLMYIIEGQSNGFEDIPKSIYWTIVTITTETFVANTIIRTVGIFASSHRIAMMNIEGTFVVIRATILDFEFDGKISCAGDFPLYWRD